MFFPYFCSKNVKLPEVEPMTESRDSLMECELKETTIEESSLISMPNSTNEKIDSLTDSRSDSPVTQAKSSTVSKPSKDSFYIS